MAQDTYVQSGIGGKNALDVNQVGPIPLPVFIVDEDPSNPQLPVISFNSITAVPSNVNTLLFTYTAPPAKTFYAARAFVSGSNIAKFELYINGVLFGRKRTWFGEGLNEVFELSLTPQTGVKLNAGDTLNIMVEQFRPDLGDFEASIIGLLVG